MAFDKARHELAEAISTPARQATILAGLALAIAVVALIVVIAKAK